MPSSPSTCLSSFAGERGRYCLGRGYSFSWWPLLTASLLMHIVLFVPSDLCSLMLKCDHICFVISRRGYQVLIDFGALGFTIIMGVTSGLLTGQCETTLLPPLSRVQSLGQDCNCPMVGHVCAHLLPNEPTSFSSSQMR